MKRIIACSDGTWNRPSVKADGKYVRTNVQKLFEAIANKDAAGIYQAKYYDEGIGAEGTWWSKMINGATGRGIDENILDIYKFLIWNYELGDEIYLFGFSRGAYTARSVAGLVRSCGILRENNLRRIDEAYDIYRTRNDDRYRPAGEVATEFRNKYSYDDKTKIKLVGVWDTVGSLGIPVRSFQWMNKKKYQFHDTTLSAIVENAFHALAIDERRSNFQPTLWQQSKNANVGANKQVLEQVWFPGVHSNVGGGYPDEGLSDIALRWMIGKAKNTGLAFDENYISNNVAESVKGTAYNSNGFPFNIVPAYVRPVCETTDAFEKIHPSAFERIKLITTYKPENLSGKEALPDLVTDV